MATAEFRTPNPVRANHTKSALGFDGLLCSNQNARASPHSVETCVFSRDTGRIARCPPRSEAPGVHVLCVTKLVWDREPYGLERHTVESAQ